MDQANRLADAGRFADAIAIVEKERSILPRVLELQVLLGFLHARQNERAKARRILSDALATFPGHALSLAALAQLMYLDGDYALAAETYAQALTAQPNDVSTRRNFAACLLELGDRSKGEALLRAVAASAPSQAGQAIKVLASTSHGRFFLRPSAAAQFLRG